MCEALGRLAFATEARRRVVPLGSAQPTTRGAPALWPGDAPGCWPDSYLRSAARKSAICRARWPISTACRSRRRRRGAGDRRCSLRRPRGLAPGRLLASEPQVFPSLCHALYAHIFVKVPCASPHRPQRGNIAERSASRTALSPCDQLPSSPLCDLERFPHLTPASLTFATLYQSQTLPDAILFSDCLTFARSPKPAMQPGERTYTFIADPTHKENLSGRVTAACLNCRRKKIKCSGEANCRQCQEKGLVCEVSCLTLSSFRAPCPVP